MVFTYQNHAGKLNMSALNSGGKIMKKVEHNVQRVQAVNPKGTQYVRNHIGKASTPTRYGFDKTVEPLHICEDNVYIGGKTEHKNEEDITGNVVLKLDNGPNLREGERNSSKNSSSTVQKLTTFSVPIKRQNVNLKQVDSMDTGSECTLYNVTTKRNNLATLRKVLINNTDTLTNQITYPTTKTNSLPKTRDNIPEKEDSMTKKTAQRTNKMEPTSQKRISSTAEKNNSTEGNGSKEAGTTDTRSAKPGTGKNEKLLFKYKLPIMYKFCFSYFIFFLLILQSTEAHIKKRSFNASANFRLREKKILDAIIGPGNYDKRIRPAGANDTGPAIVYINIMIRNVQTISDVKMEYAIQITFREQWTDQRLVFDSMGGRIQYLTLTETDMVWMPDLFFKNEKEGHFHNIILPNLYIRIYPDGGVLYSIRISLTLSCPMNLKLFPLDRQQCQLLMASYGWTTEDLVFLWKDVDPVQVTKNLHLPRFTLEKFITDYCNSKTNTGAYSCLRVDLIFKREFSYYLIQYYIPCCMLVIVSWVSFWLDQNAVPARVALGVTTLLTMSTQTSSINQSLPPVSYTKAIDVWTGVCLTFVFGALLEFALVNYASRSDKHREKMKEKVKEQKKQWEMEMEAAAMAAEQVEDGTSGFAMKPLVSRRNGGMPGGGMDKGRPCEIHLQPQKKNFCKTWLSKFPTRSKRIDVISRITFPLVFAFFNMAYWSTYLFTEEDEDVKP